MLSGLNTMLVRKCPRPAVSTPAPVPDVITTDGPTANKTLREFTSGAPLLSENPAPPTVKGKARRVREAEQGTDAPQSEESYEEEEEMQEEVEEMQEEVEEEEMQEEIEEEIDEEIDQEEEEDDIEGDGEINNMLSKRKRRSVPSQCQPGTGFYGIFQLSDRIFCDSGENPTKNLCRTKCSGECLTWNKGSCPQ